MGRIGNFLRRLAATPADSAFVSALRERVIQEGRAGSVAWMCSQLFQGGPVVEKWSMPVSRAASLSHSELSQQVGPEEASSLVDAINLLVQETLTIQASPDYVDTRRHNSQTWGITRVVGHDIVETKLAEFRLVPAASGYSAPLGWLLRLQNLQQYRDNFEPALIEEAARHFFGVTPDQEPMR